MKRISVTDGAKQAARDADNSPGEQGKTCGSHDVNRVTYVAVGVVIVQNTKRYGRKDASKVEEERRREHLLRRLDATQAVLVIGCVVGQSASKILADPLAEAAQLFRFLIIKWRVNSGKKRRWGIKDLRCFRRTTGGSDSCRGQLAPRPPALRPIPACA